MPTRQIKLLNDLDSADYILDDPRGEALTSYHEIETASLGAAHPMRGGELSSVALGDALASIHGNLDAAL